jgi:hypothetical protein
VDISVPKDITVSTVHLLERRFSALIDFANLAMRV